MSLDAKSTSIYQRDGTPISLWTNAITRCPFDEIWRKGRIVHELEVVKIGGRPRMCLEANCVCGRSSATATHSSNFKAKE